MMIPVRLSIDDDGYDPAVGALLFITLDGVPQSRVVAYDAEAGWVRRYVTDEHGFVQLNEARNGFEKETVSGAVEVQLNQ